MRTLVFLFCALCFGCSDVSGKYPYYFGLPDSGSSTDTDVDSDTDSDSDSDTEADSGVDSGDEDGGSTNLPCDGGACCSSSGFVKASGSPCVLDDLPEGASPFFTSEGKIPQEFRCKTPDVCGGGEERRAGEVVCNGESPHCNLGDIVWGPWEVTLEVTPSNTICNDIHLGIVWYTYLTENKTDPFCTFGCENGECLPGPPAVEGEECLHFQCGDYCVAMEVDLYNCGGECGNNCWDHGGNICSWVGETDETACFCGTDPPCDSGYICQYDFIFAKDVCVLDI